MNPLSVRIELIEIKTSTKTPVRVSPIVNNVRQGVAITLDSSNLEQSEEELCSIIEKAYRQGHRTGFLQAQKLMKEALGFYD